MSIRLNDQSREEFFAFPANGDYNSLENHAFRFKDDRWDFSKIIHNPSSHSIGEKTINFALFPETIRPIIKRFSYHSLSSLAPQTTAMKINRLRSYILDFMNEYNLTYIEQFNTQIFLNLNAWLREKYITQPLTQGKKPATEVTLYHYVLSLKQLLDMATLHGWQDGPCEAINLSDTFLIEIWGVARKYTKEKRLKTAEKRLIPRPIWDAIVNAARGEEKYRTTKMGKIFVYKSGQAKGIRAVNSAKYIFLTLAWSGLRIGEIMALKSGCTFKDKMNRCWLKRTTTKTVKEPTEGDIRIPKELHEALLELETLTKSYRKQSGMDRLFFVIDTQHNNSVVPISKEALHPMLSAFRKRNPIYDDNGELYHYTPHDFRHTLASILVNDFNVSLTTMLRHYAHLSLEMTMHYTHLSKETIKKRALMGFMHTDKIIFNGKEGENFVKKLNDAKTEKDLDSAITKIADAYGINSLPFGLCIYDYRRGHCPNLGVQSCWEIGCKEFVTSSSFLPNFEHERDTLEIQIERDKRLGQIVSAKMKNIKYGKIVKIIGDLSLSEDKNA